MQPHEWLRMIDAQIRYYLHQEPNDMDDNQWANAYMELVWIREQEAAANKK